MNHEPNIWWPLWMIDVFRVSESLSLTIWNDPECRKTHPTYNALLLEYSCMFTWCWWNLSIVLRQNKTTYYVCYSTRCPICEDGLKGFLYVCFGSFFKELYLAEKIEKRPSYQLKISHRSPLESTFSIWYTLYECPNVLCFPHK